MKRYPRYVNGRPTPTFVTWHNMNARCEQAFRDDAEYYWAKGIRVCDRWARRRKDGSSNPSGFDLFVEDMGERPRDPYRNGYMSIGRLEQDKGYFKENCEWQTWTEQNQGLTYLGSTVIEVDGVALQQVEWAELLGITYKSLLQRLRRGWGLDAYRIKKGGKRHV